MSLSKSELLYDRLKKRMAREPAMVFVIYAKPSEEDLPRQLAARNAWLAYLKLTGHDSMLRSWKNILFNGGGKAITVPTEKPEYFDLTYAVPDDPREVWEGPRPWKELRGDIRETVEQTLAELQAAVPKGKTQRVRQAAERVYTPQENLALMAEGLPQMPVKLSPEVIKKLHQGR